jgi:cell division GTPase FtsZ
VDTLIVIPNQNLLVESARNRVTEAFKKVDSVSTHANFIFFEQF